MGLGLALGGWAINKTYPLLLDNFVLQNITKSRAYSIGLGPMNDSTGSLIFGGIDTKKFSGQLAKQPIVESVDGNARLTIDYETLSIVSPGIRSRTFNVTNKNALVDSGITFSKLQASLVSELWNVTGAAESNTSGYPLVDCAVRDLEGGLIFRFSGVNVTVSFSDLVYEVDDVCALGVVKIEDGDQQILGDSFMRSAYTVFGLDNKTYT